MNDKGVERGAPKIAVDADRGRGRGVHHPVCRAWPIQAETAVTLRQTAKILAPRIKLTRPTGMLFCCNTHSP